MCIFSRTSCGISGKNFIRSISVPWSLALVGVTVFTDKIIAGVDIPDLGEKIINFGSLYPIYVSHFLLFFGLSFWFLFMAYLQSQEVLVRDQIKYLFIGTFLASFLGMLTNLILPWMGYFTLNWLGNILTIFFVGFILYAILKYRLFNVKIIATEVFVIFILITLFVDLFFVQSTAELIIKAVVLTSTAFLGYLLIKGVYKEVETREKIEKLATELKKANAKLRELDQLKSEFLSLATHQIRSPISAIFFMGISLLA